MAEVKKTEGEKKIKLSERVKVTGTGRSQFYKEGETHEVHPELAKKLKEAGKVK